MSSINTNNSAMNALSIMRNVNNNLNQTQERIATGLKVVSAKDNAAYFSISETMKGDNGMYKAIDEGLTMTKNVVSTARLGAETFTDLVRQMGERVAFATGEGVDKAKVKEELVALTDRMKTVLDQSTFNGVSMVGDEADVTVVTGVSRDATGGISATTITLKNQDLAAIHSTLEGIANGFDTTADVAADLVDVELELAKSVASSTTFGIAEKSIETQQDFLKSLTKRIDSGVGAMVDANMEEEAARLQALQVQQQLATQALSIANQGPQNIMALFR